ncbi:hypothetical protein ES703_49225 [subsurface metagenome]
MTLIRFPEGQQRSGSSGGLTFSHNRFGAYIRPRSVPVNPNTDRQVAVRNAVRSITIAWQNTLTQVQRDAWETYADTVSWSNKFGDSVKLTGLNHYVRSNTPRVQNGIARIDAAPPPGSGLATAELGLAVTASEATQQLTIDGVVPADWQEADGWQFVFMGLPQAAGIKFFGGPYKQITAIPGAGPPPFPAVVATAFPFVEGNRIWVRTRVARGDGRLSEFAQVNFLAAA